MPILFDPVQASDLPLPNRIFMAPLTRNRSPDAAPTPPWRSTTRSAPTPAC